MSRQSTNRLWVMWAGIIAVSLAIPFAFTTKAAGQDPPFKDVTQVVSEFQIEIELIGGEISGKPVLAGNTRFRIDRSDAGASVQYYTLYYYENGRVMAIEKECPLPYILKRTYKGLNNGDYVLTFVLQDQQGRFGKKDVDVRVSR